MKKLVILRLAILAGAMAIALPTLSFAQSEEEPTAEVERDSDELICTMEQQTGSRIRQRVCRTQDEIDQEHEAAREFIGRTRERTAQNDNRTN